MNQNPDNRNNNFFEGSGNQQPADQIYMPGGYQPQTPPPPVPPKTNGLAIGSLVLGILSIVCCCCCVGVNIIMGIIAIILAVVSRNSSGGKLSGMAIAGIVLGILGIIGGIISVIAMIGFYGSEEWAKYYNEFSNNGDPEKLLNDIFNDLEGRF